MSAWGWKKRQRARDPAVACETGTSLGAASRRSWVKLQQTSTDGPRTVLSTLENSMMPKQAILALRVTTVPHPRQRVSVLTSNRVRRGHPRDSMTYTWGQRSHVGGIALLNSPPIANAPSRSYPRSSQWGPRWSPATSSQG
ncbi:hypothetical protein BHM03_00050160 [Ensete ventricosum]|nr:hypothetical protein BHM03_00050160 [Ensete ventricosum]